MTYDVKGPKVCSKREGKDAMCTGQCSRFIGLSLYPLAAISVLCNIILFFPGWDTKVLVPAIYIHATGKQGCCANRCGSLKGDTPQ
ncbi:hypothetical protein CRUP_026009 [Coryphaenoides rupestris]|nr:hypothetical protein CRUP_026009 [Coryphaenoides rupestris]